MNKKILKRIQVWGVLFTLALCIVGYNWVIIMKQLNKDNIVETVNECTRYSENEALWSHETKYKLVSTDTELDENVLRTSSVYKKYAYTKGSHVYTETVKTVIEKCEF